MIKTIFILLVGAIGMVGCNDMYDGHKMKPLQESKYYADHLSARQIPEGTVARGYDRTDELLYTGRIDSVLADAFPFEITDDVMKTGQHQFSTFCTPCHGRLGDGNGMIVQRGFPRPNSYHADSIRSKPAGYYFDVITNGFGRMYSYAPSVPVRDRWAIVAYIRALQLSQRAPTEELSSADRISISKAAK